MKRFAFFLLVPPLFLMLLAVAVIWAPLPYPLPPAGSGTRNRLSAVAVGTLGMIYLGGLTIYLVSLARGAASVLDEVLLPAGLISTPHLVVGRRYHGMINGRAVEVTFLPAYGITSALLNVTVDAGLGTRIAVGCQRPRLDCTDCARVKVERSGLRDLYIVAEDGERARRLVSSPAVSAALARLVIGPPREIHEVYLQPERVWLRARPRCMTAHSFADWLGDVERLAQAGETLLSPRGR